MFRQLDYQSRVLATLSDYFTGARVQGPNLAFYAMTNRPYRSAPGFESVPYVCLRIPTGGGKTVIAAQAVGVAAKTWFQRDVVTCLWLVPSNAIRSQTITRLRDVDDPYHQLLASSFQGNVAVMDLSEVTSVSAATLESETCVIVATLASLRVTDTEGRRVYEENGALLPHLEGLTAQESAGLERFADGRIVPSLANVLHMVRPLVIVDEAHNARTSLSFTTLARFGPSAIVEFTATPAVEHRPHADLYASNILDHVSAAELKADAMVKLPIRIQTKLSWREAIDAALAARRHLEQESVLERERTGEYVRPIILFQARPRGGDGEAVTADVVRDILINDHGIAEAEIKIETGERRELEGIDLSDSNCVVRYVITVQALREGWDCPMAYVLCSLASLHSARAVEQLLGRVMRLPNARTKVRRDLNQAYAVVVSASFTAAALGLRDALVAQGFERFEAEAFVQPEQELHGTLPLFRRFETVRVEGAVNTTPDLSRLPEALTEAVSYDSTRRVVVLTQPLGAEAIPILTDCFENAADKATVQEMIRQSSGVLTPMPIGEQVELRIPALGIRVDGQLEIPSAESFLDASWRLAELNANLTVNEFTQANFAAEAGVLDVNAAGAIALTAANAEEQQELLAEDPAWDAERLAIWMDAQISHPDLSQLDVTMFLQRMVEAVAQRDGVSVPRLALHRYRLAAAARAKIDALRQTHRTAVFQRLLFSEEAVAEIAWDFETDFSDPNSHIPDAPYPGPIVFRKHLFELIGAMNAEEAECAAAIDQHPLVKSWVRNLERRRSTSFSLPTTTDRFYPDFVGVLQDNRLFVVEHKRHNDFTNADSVEKRAVGNLWARLSEGRCIFVMTDGPRFEALDAAFRAG